MAREVLKKDVVISAINFVLERMLTIDSMPLETQRIFRVFSTPSTCKVIITCFAWAQLKKINRNGFYSFQVDGLPISIKYCHKILQFEENLWCLIRCLSGFEFEFWFTMYLHQWINRIIWLCRSDLFSVEEHNYSTTWHGTFFGWSEWLWCFDFFSTLPISVVVLFDFISIH